MAESQQGKVPPKHRPPSFQATSELTEEEWGEPTRPPVSLTPTADPEPKKDKTRPEPSSLEEFIEHAYKRKGQRVSLSEKTEKAISQDFILRPDVQTRLLEIAKQDSLLLVPKQLLLVAHGIKRYPPLRTELQKFILAALNQNPLFTFHQLSDVLRNIPGSMSPERALSKVFATDIALVQKRITDFNPKLAEYKKLQANLIYCIAIFLEGTYSYSLLQISKLLYDSLWMPSAPKDADTTHKLRILTDITDVEGVGQACSLFKTEVDVQTASNAALQSRIRNLEENVVRLEGECKKSAQELQIRDDKLRGMEAQLLNERKSHEDALTHLRDDKEQMRAKLLRRLKAEANLLSDGLHALRRDPPKIHVMDDHAARVLDGLYAAIKELDLEK